MSSHLHNVLPWVVRRSRLPLIALPCVACPSTRATTGAGRFRVNANGKLLDVWLLVNCVACDRTGKLTVHDRVPVRSLAPELLAGYTVNASALVAAVLLDPSFARLNRFTLVWEGRWELCAPKPPECPWPPRFEVVFEDPVPVRPERLLAHGLGLSRSEVARRVEADVPLNRRTARGFSFVLV